MKSLNVDHNLYPNSDSVPPQWQCSLAEVPRVHPADFVALFTTKGLSLEPVGICADKI